MYLSSQVALLQFELCEEYSRDLSELPQVVYPIKYYNVVFEQNCQKRYSDPIAAPERYFE